MKYKDILEGVKNINIVERLKEVNRKYDSVPEPWKFAIAMAIGAVLLVTKKAMIILLPAVLIARTIRDKNEEE